ncbi:DUF397 domain-containing protein [Streptomyces sp. M2CJ-2]|uniref:DUF397 domain-containing protein n=1 Tax=Streptomyces sp. M2CJ-2 TaxID=2803948 RepID=UPI001920FE5B|nr:DUF397 domain-containing protein [Streptomyces sp. M2CJ-2]MBL3665475.1 DUF397 domain-containing protein [Streptomyces sp. M2CJ-2]
MSERLTWFKSSYSDSQGGNCLEAALDWCKSSHSGTEGGNCVEVAPCPHTIHVRDSKLGSRSPRFAVAGATWTAFVAYACTGA